MRILLSTLFVVVWLYPSLALSQGVAMEELLDSVVKSHPLFSRETRAVDIEAQSLHRAQAMKDWNLTSSVSYAYQEPAGEDLFLPVSSHSMGFELGLERRLWSTGGRFAFSFGEAYVDQDLPFLDFGEVSIQAGVPYYYQTQAYVTYSQPLWQNWGGDLDRLEYELAEFSVELTTLRALENQERFLLNVGIGYLDWALYLQQSAIISARLDLAEEELTQVRRRREMNLVEEVDVLRAVDAVHSALEAVVRIDARYRSKQAELAEISQRDDLYRLAPKYDLYEMTELPDAEWAATQMRERSRILRALDVAKEQLERQLAAARSIHDPDLSLDMGYGIRQEDDRFLDALAVSEPDAFVALNLRLPLGRRQAKSDIQKLELLILQVEDEAREIEIQLESTLRSLLIEIDRLAEVLDLDRQRIESARQKAAEELRLYSQGRGQLTFLISARDDVQRAELNLSQNAAVYQKLLLQYRELMDKLFEEEKTGSDLDM
jgi:outer membrane protein TolC